ncbi:MAG: site-specific integrase [Pseudonocardiaceae bacterium]
MSRFGLVNEFLGYLADRNYSPGTRRSYAFDLLAFARWLDGEGIGLAGVDVDVLLRFLTACREAVLPGRAGGNVYSIRDGRNSGYAPATINRRLAAISALFAFQEMRDPAARNPVPHGRAARMAARGERGGLLAHVAKPKARSRLRVREPRRLPRGLTREESAALLGSFRTWRDTVPHLGKLLAHQIDRLRPGKHIHHQRHGQLLPIRIPRRDHHMTRTPRQKRSQNIRGLGVVIDQQPPLPIS